VPNPCVATSSALRGYYASAYRPQRLVGARPGTLEAYEVALRHFDRFAALRPAPLTLDGITTDVIAAFSAYLLAIHAAVTANKTIRHVLSIVRYAVDQGAAYRVPEWRKLREPKRVPLAFTVEEFAAILAAVAILDGEICGIPARLWWRSLLLADWYTGARITALLAVQQADVALDDGGLYLRPEQAKDHEEQFLDLGPEAIAAIQAAWAPRRRLMWPWPFCPRVTAKHFARLCQAAKVPLRKGTGSKFHRIRKSTASYLKLAGGDPTGRLGHSTQQVTKSYFDPRICGQSRQAWLLPGF
jgi:integrase